MPYLGAVPVAAPIAYGKNDYLYWGSPDKSSTVPIIAIGLLVAFLLLRRK